MVHVVLQLVVYPAAVLYLMNPVIGIQFRARVKLVMPHEAIAIGGIVGSLFGSLLGDCDGLAGSTAHNGDSCSAGIGCRVSGNDDLQRARCGRRILGIQRDEILVGIGAPFLTRYGNTN